MRNTNLYLRCGALFGVLASTATAYSAQKDRGGVVVGGKRYNVVYVMCDDLNDYEGVFGGHPQAKTPNIDRIAKSGVQFVNAYSNSPVSQPSRNSLFTGVHAVDSKDFGWTARCDQPVLKNNKTIMRMFRENGYTVYGTGKLLHNNEYSKEFDHYGLQSGIKWSITYGPFVAGVDANGEPTTTVHKDVPYPYNKIGAVDGSYGPMTSEQEWVYGWELGKLRYNSANDRDPLPDEMQAAWAVEQLQDMSKRQGDDPFFLGVGFCRPHTPLHVPAKYYDMFPIDELELANWLPNDEADTYFAKYREQLKKGFIYYEQLLKSYGGDRELAIKSFLQGYLACVTFADEQIGKVWDALQESPYKDNTIFVLTSDHGWQMGEKSYLFKESLWDESTHIPLLVCHPDAVDASQVEQAVSLVDIFPTLVDMCGLEGDNRLNADGAELSGHSMLPLLNGQEWRGPNGAVSIVGGVGTKSSIFEQHLSYRTKDWRYIRYRNGSEELYDHQKDPNEWTNIANDRAYKAIKKQLKEELCDVIGVQLR
ncbi:MAG: sulfatase [Rikenellaceae bacterium]